MEAVLRYTYRLRPGAVAERALLAEWDRCRWLWNQAVERKKHQRPWLSDKDLTGLRKDRDWLAAGSVVCQQQTLRVLRQTKARKFKARRRALPSLNYTRRGFSVARGRLRLAGGISLPVVWSRELPSDPSSVRVYRDSLGHWYASFVVRREEVAIEHTGAAVGIDWGVKAVATASDPDYDLPHAEHGKRSAARLEREQRKMSRRRPMPGRHASNGYRHAKRQAARVHKKVRRQRGDAARKWAARVVADHSLIAVEDFKPRFLAKSTMARKAADGAVGLTKRELVERAMRAGREVVLVPPAYTTMTCAECLTRTKSRLALSERTFWCEFCGQTADRDRNAARTILATAGLYRAGVEAVRHSDLPSGERRVRAESGIPRP